ncbi:MAG: sigma-70 family RNA polymerase sigma factor [Gammaproteobacteria bacterium]|nr:sigma-70 family RNA polymerase sigma factor [Gammaproteobacteria bacterium]
MTAIALQLFKFAINREPAGRVSLTPVTIKAVTADRIEFETALLLRIGATQDAAAFDALFNALAKKVYGYLIRSGGCTSADGENLLQDIWLTVWTKAGLFDPTRASARTWVFALARHALIDLKRAQSREHGVFETHFAEHADTAGMDEHYAERVDGDKTVAVLQQLAPEQAQVLVMAYVEGKSHREIARELGLPIGTVKSRLRLGFARMRTLLPGPA